MLSTRTNTQTGKAQMNDTLNMFNNLLSYFVYLENVDIKTTTHNISLQYPISLNDAVLKGRKQFAT